MRRFTFCVALISLAVAASQSSFAKETADPAGEKYLARVGEERIVEADVVPFADEQFLQAIARNPERFSHGQAGALRVKLIQDRLDHLIEVKLVLLDARKSLDSELLTKATESIADDFEKKEIPRLLVCQKLRSREELESTLKRQGASLDRQKQEYMERQLAYGWMHRQAQSAKTGDARQQALRDYLAKLKETYPVKLGGE